MTESVPQYPWASVRPDGDSAKPPGVVQAAAIVTWIGTAGTAVLTVLMTVVWLWVAAPAFGAFDSGANNPRWWVIGFALSTLVLSGVAAAFAFRVWRGDRWAWWGLLALSALAAVGGVVTAYAVLPVLVALLAITTCVLLLLRESRAWTGGSH